MESLSDVQIGFIGIGALVTLIALRVPIGVSLIGVSFFGIWGIVGYKAAWGMLGVTRSIQLRHPKTRPASALARPTPRAPPPPHSALVPEPRPQTDAEGGGQAVLKPQARGEPGPNEPALQSSAARRAKARMHE